MAIFASYVKLPEGTLSLTFYTDREFHLSNIISGWICSEGSPNCRCRNGVNFKGQKPTSRGAPRNTKSLSLWWFVVLITIVFMGFINQVITFGGPTLYRKLICCWDICLSCHLLTSMISMILSLENHKMDLLHSFPCPVGKMIPHSNNCFPAVSRGTTRALDLCANPSVA